MELTQIVEALLIASPDPISAKALAKCIRTATDAESDNADEALAAFGKVSEDEILGAIIALNDQYVESGRAFLIAERASGWKIFTRGEFSRFARELFPGKKPQRLSAPALETLAIIAYRQPLTKAAIEAVRGVAVDGVLQTLLDRNLARIGGRADLPGRPLLYETTDIFFEHFGVKGIDELPNADELRTVPLPDAEEKEKIKEAAEAAAAKGAAEEGDGDEGSEPEAEAEAEAEEASGDGSPNDEAEDAAGDAEATDEPVDEESSEGEEEEEAAAEEEAEDEEAAAKEN